MTDQRQPITNDDLHGLVDGRLDADRRAEIENYLGENTEARASTAAWRRQNGVLHALFDPAGADAVTAPLHARAIRAAASHRGAAVRTALPSPPP